MLCINHVMYVWQRRQFTKNISVHKIILTHLFASARTFAQIDTPNRYKISNSVAVNYKMDLIRVEGSDFNLHNTLRTL